MPDRHVYQETQEMMVIMIRSRMSSVSTTLVVARKPCLACMYTREDEINRGCCSVSTMCRLKILNLTHTQSTCTRDSSKVDKELCTGRKEGKFDDLKNGLKGRKRKREVEEKEM